MISCTSALDLIEIDIAYLEKWSINVSRCLLRLLDAGVTGPTVADEILCHVLFIVYSIALCVTAFRLAVWNAEQAIYSAAGLSQVSFLGIFSPLR